jgi:chromosome segregation ATPase
MSATTIRLFEQMAIIQEEMRKTEMDMGRMERAFTDLSAHANALDAELASTRAERDTLQSANSELQTQLHESQADVDRMAKRVKELVSENTEYKANLEHEKSERALLSRELQEETERAHTLDMANIDLKEQVKKLEGELGTAKAQLAIMEENFLVARQQAADASARADELGKTLKELEGKSLMVSCAFSPCPLCPQF